MATAIKVEGVSKRYKLGVVNHGALFRDIQSWMARRRGEEDPHGKIGAISHIDGPREYWALKDVSFDVEQGDRIGLIGRNGAGKSTMLKILSRITAPTEGLIKVRGRVASLLEVGTGFHPELTGRENVFLNGSILGMKRREVARKFDEIVAFSEIDKFIDTPVKRYSSGMYVRLAFAVAAHLDSEILLADEVLAVGDAAFQKKCLGKMEDVSRNEGRTVVFVSHNSAALRTLCQKGIWFEKGVLNCVSEMESVIRSYLRMNSNNDYSMKKKLADIVRQGNGKAKGEWVSVTPIGSDGTVKEEFNSGDDLEISMGIIAKESIYNANVECLFKDDLGSAIVYGNLTMVGKTLSMRTGEKAVVKWRFRNLLLNPGEYMIRLYIGEPNVDVDSMDEVVLLKVIDPADSRYRAIFPGKYRCDFDMAVAMADGDSENRDGEMI